MSHSVRRRCAAAGLVVSAALASGGATVALAPVASAHSVLVSIDPAANASLAPEATPKTITLTFNEEVNPDFATVVVRNGAKKDFAAGTPTVAGEKVSAGLNPLDPGNYTVGYRVTSADGHVVQGTSRFVVTNADGSAPADESANAQGEENSEESSGVNPALWIVGGLAVALIVGAGVLLLRGRSKS